MMRSIIIIFFLFLTNGAQAARIRFGGNESNSTPLLYQLSNPNLATGGLIYEISVAIADDLANDYDIVRIPRAQIAKQLINGSIDMACHIGTTWQHDFKNEVEWSKPLYKYANVLVAKNPIPSSQFKNITNASIGTVNNYFYKDLELIFKDDHNKITRVDSDSVPINVNKLLEKKIDYIVMSEIEFIYYKKKYPEIHRSSFTMDQTDIHCVLSKKSWLPMQRLKQSIERLKSKQVFQKIYDRYKDPKIMYDPILYGVIESNAPPFFFSDTSTRPPTVTGGIYFDLALAIGKKLNRPLQFILLPRNRIDGFLFKGKVELICFKSELWSEKHAKDFYWSIPIFNQKYFIVSNKATIEITKMKSLEDLKGQTLGTRLGFVYPSLTEYFKDGSVIREDVVSGESNVAKLIHKRVAYIILNNHEYIYYKKKNPNLTKAPIEFDSVSSKCAVSKKSSIKIKDVNGALKELIASDQLQKLLIYKD